MHIVPQSVPVAFFPLGLDGGDPCDRAQFELAYQPVMCAADPNGRPAFHEALLRQVLPDGRILTPPQFCPDLAQSGIGPDLDRRALTLGLREMIAEPGLRLSINVDPRTLEDAAWHATLEKALVADATLGERLILEITERAPLPEGCAAGLMRAKWRKAGISLALDDFGAGQTAVRHLPIWRFDIVKIDGGFTRDVHRNPDNQAMMGALMDLAHHFEAMTVAEHVENAADAAWLTARGAGGLQGHLFANASLHKPWRAATARRHIA